MFVVEFLIQSIEFFTRSFGKLAYIDVMIIAAYLALCLYSGYRHSGNIKNIKDYTLGTGSISTAALVSTIYATYLDAGATIGTIERISAIGVLVAVSVLLTPISWWLSYIIFGRNIEQFKGSLTLMDIMYNLYGKAGSIVTVCENIFNCMATLAAQIMALGYLLHYFLDISIGMGMFIGMGTIIFYSTLGGIRAVVVTDMFQFGIFYVILPVLCGLLLYKFGSWQEINNMIPARIWNVDLSSTAILYIFLGSILYSIRPGVDEVTFMQRLLMSMNVKQLKQSFTILAFIDISIGLTICVFAFVLSTNIQGEVTAGDVIWHMINTELFMVLKGIVIVGVTAIIMSTADSYLNSTSALIAHNIFKALLPNITDKTELLIARISTVCVGCLAMLLTLYGSSNVLSMIWIAISFHCPIMTVPLAAGFLKFRTNTRSFIAAVSLAILCTFAGAYIQGKFDILSTVLGMLGSSIGLFGMHYLQKTTGRLENIASRAIEMSVEETKTAVGISVIKDIVKAFKFLGRLKNFRFGNIALYSQMRVLKYEGRYYEFAVIGIIFSTYTLLSPDFIYGGGFNNELYFLWSVEMVMRVLFGFGCLVIAFHHAWSDKAQGYLPLYYHFMLMCTLPVLSTYSYLVFPENKILLAAAILAVFALALLVDCLTFVIIAFTGFVLGNVLHIIFSLMTPQGIIYQDTINVPVIFLVLASIMAWLLHFIREKKLTQLQHTAVTDKLSGLYNRHYLDSRLKTMVEYSISRKKSLSVMLIDIDHFKGINDNYGHLSGDIVIQRVARYITEDVRPGDICARYGGEEFMILMPDTNLKEAEIIAERLRQKVQSNMFVIPSKPGNVKCSVSIGVAQLKEDDSIDSLTNRVDIALYKAKKAGRNRIASEELIPVNVSNANDSELEAASS